MATIIDQQTDSDAVAVPGGPAPAGPRAWWERHWTIGLAILAAMIPLLYPPVPPLVDLPGHMGRYRVILDLAHSPALQAFYAFHWEPIGNLGVDLMVVPLGKVLGLEAAVKFIILMIPPMAAAGLLWVANEVHHRIPPTAFFALPFVYGYPFLFGFVNFALSMALALLGFGLWLRFARYGHFRLRALIFAPLAFVLYFTHVFGWGVLGLLCYSAEAVRQHDSGRAWWKAAFGAIPHAAVMAGPLLLILLWRSDVAHPHMTYGWFEWDNKWDWLIGSLRDRWKDFDKGMVFVTFAVLFLAVVSRRLGFSRNLAFSALVLATAFVLIPWKVFGSAYADMRLAPYVLAIAVLAIRVRPGKTLPYPSLVAGGALAFWGVKVAATTLSFAIASNAISAHTAGLGRIPQGARLATITGLNCGSWALRRESHIASLALVRREAFANDQWVVEGGNLLTVKYLAAGPFRTDASQMAMPNICPSKRIWTIDRALEALPRDSFDYLWLVTPPSFDPQLIDGMRPIWQGRGSILYRIDHRPKEVPVQ